MEQIFRLNKYIVTKIKIPVSSFRFNDHCLASFEKDGGNIVIRHVKNSKGVEVTATGLPPGNDTMLLNKKQLETILKFLIETCNE